MTIDLILFITIIPAIVGVCTFFVGRKSAAKSDGRELGEIKTDVKHAITMLNELKSALAAAINEERAERKESIRRLYEKIDEHVKIYHTAK